MTMTELKALPPLPVDYDREITICEDLLEVCFNQMKHCTGYMAMIEMSRRIVRIADNWNELYQLREIEKGKDFKVF